MTAEQRLTPYTFMKKFFFSHSIALLGAIALTVSTTTKAADGDFKPLFDGKSLSGWDGNKELWSVKDGVIHGETMAEKPIKGNTFLIWTNGTVADFELHFTYRIMDKDNKGFGNSGIQYRSKVVDPANWVVGGYQADFEFGKTYSGILYEERFRGILAQRGQKTVIKDDGGKTKVEVVGSLGKSEDIQAVIKPREWNDYVVIAKGNHLQHFINGQQTIDVTDEQPDKAAKSGILALQIHAGQPMIVEFKEINIKTISK
ncbi:MAG: Trehalose utilization [Verrucomicrobiales bacterium]|nr:Trehalose utilization [Verrucomicrobiales bacterium]